MAEQQLKLYLDIIAELAERGVHFNENEWGTELVCPWDEAVDGLDLAEEMWEKPRSEALDDLVREGNLTLVTFTDSRGLPRTGVRIFELINLVHVFSGLRSCRKFTTWLCCEFLPAIRKHGYYDPATGHQAPVGGELDALERKEEMKDRLNELFPNNTDNEGESE